MSRLPRTVFCCIALASFHSLVGSLSLSLAAEQPSLVRPRLDLSGAWQFRMDPADEGVAGRWFQPETPFPDTIRVPGNWQAQGFGPPDGWLRHNYQGKAWYRRTVTVPADWQGRRIRLHLGGTANTADVYVNGRKIGQVDDFLTPAEFDITNSVNLGRENTIACRVDSVNPALVGESHFLGMFNFLCQWGGLYRHVWLEASSDPAIDDVFVIPDVKHRTACARIMLRNGLPTSWQGELRVRVRPGDGSQSDDDQSAIVRASVTLPAETASVGPIVVDVPLAGMHTWSPEDPFLYEIEVELTSGQRMLDMVHDRFGMRQFEVGPRGQLLLNGRPYFIRGAGDDSFEVLTGTQYPDKQIYIERLRTIKQYGFNGVRFLAHTPIKEYFEAADEVGMLVMAEAAVYRKPKELIPLLKSQVARITTTYRNHPSWYAWSAANELNECEREEPDPDWMGYVLDAHATFKRLDPTRFFLGSDGQRFFPTDVVTPRWVFDVASEPAPEHPFNGLISEVAFFRRALSEAEMLTAANCSVTDYPSVITAMKPDSYWRLNESSPSQATDSSGNLRHGDYDDAVESADLGPPGALLSPALPTDSSEARTAANPVGTAELAVESGSLATPESIAGLQSGGALRSSAGKGVSLRQVAGGLFSSGNEPFSVSLWVEPAGFRRDDWGNCFAFGLGVRGNALLIAEDGAGGTGKIVLGRCWDNVLTSIGSLAAGRWNHIGVCYDGEELRLFLDGKPDTRAKVRLNIIPSDGRIGGAVPAPDYQRMPHIWHEFPSSYVGTLHDVTMDEKFTGIFRDDGYLNSHRRQIAELGLTDRYAEIYQRSVDLYYQYLKHQFEGARHLPTLDGFGFWLMTDTPSGSEGDSNFLGILNLLYQPSKFPNPATLRQFNDATVLLIDRNIDQRVMAAEDVCGVPLRISHFGAQPIAGGKVDWQAVVGDRVLNSGRIEGIEAQSGDLKPIGTITLGPYHLPSACRIRLNVVLQDSIQRCENGWDFWWFPSSDTNLRGKPIRNLTGSSEIDDRYGLRDAKPSAERPLVLATRLTADVMAHLSQGGNLLLLAEQGTLLKPQNLGFWPPWIRATSTCIERHPVFDGFPHDGFCAYQFYRLFGETLEVPPLTDAGSLERQKLAPIVWALSKDYDPAVGNDWWRPGHSWKLHRHGLVCEGRIGRGHVVVCSLRLLAGLKAGYPEAGFLLDRLTAYGLSGRVVEDVQTMTPEEARTVFVSDQ